MKKRILSAILAMTMTMGMSAVSASADDINNMEDLNSAEFTADTNKVDRPTINVTVPTTGNIVLDPFNMEQKGQVYSTTQTIINNSNIPLTVTFNGVKAISSGTADVTIGTKATDSTKVWVNPSISITDGLGKTTAKPLTSADAGQAIPVATAMAPLGGRVKFSYTGTCDATAAENWTGNEKIKASNTYVFKANPYTKYTITKPALITGTATTLTVANGTVKTDVEAQLPATIVDSGKYEIPVKWVCNDYNASTASNYTFTAELLGSDVDASHIYTLGDGASAMPTITVTVAAAQ